MNRRVDPVLRHEGLAQSWVNAVQIALSQSGNPEGLTTDQVVTPVGREPIKIYVSVSGDLQRAAFNLQEYIPECEFGSQTEPVYDYCKHRYVDQKRNFILIPQKNTLPQDRVALKLDGLSVRETLWFSLSVLSLFLFAFLLYRHWAPYKEPWLGLVDTPRRLLSYLWRR